jgi:hypothetical protein
MRAVRESNLSVHYPGSKTVDRLEANQDKLRFRPEQQSPLLPAAHLTKALSTQSAAILLGQVQTGIIYFKTNKPFGLEGLNLHRLFRNTDSI